MLDYLSGPFPVFVSPVGRRQLAFLAGTHPALIFGLRIQQDDKGWFAV
jgi:hypothetical protein